MSTFQLSVKNINEAESEIKFIVVALSEIQQQLGSQISRLDSCLLFNSNYEIKDRLTSVSSNQIASVSDNLSLLASTLEDILAVTDEYEKKAAAGNLSCTDEFIPTKYSENDLRSMSKEERDNYINQLLSLENPTDKDKAEIQVVLRYLSDMIKVNQFFTAVTNKDKVELYNSLYEKVHPNDGRKINKLFEGAPSEFTNDIQYIKYIAYDSTGQCHDLFFKYADKMKISEYSYMREYDGEMHPVSCFSSSDMGMHLNMEAIRDRNNNYGTFFHEAGHNIDQLMGMEAGSNSKYSSILANGEFHDVVYKDTENVVTKVVDNYSNNENYLSNEDKALVTDVLMGRKHESELKNSKIDFAYRKISEDITGAWKGKYSRQYQSGKETGILENENSGMLSEVMNGATNDSLMVSRYNRKIWLSQGTVGHPIDWQNPEGGCTDSQYYYTSDGSPTGRGESEYMAEYFRINMTNSVEEKEYTNKYIGNSWRFLERELGKKI